jgi:hypothetical protein
MSKGGRPPFRAWRRLTKRTGELGQAVVELALVLPIFVTLLAGVIEIGDAINSYITVIDVSRDSARLASKGQATDAQIRNMAAVEMERLDDPFNRVDDMTITHNVVPGDASIRVRVCSNHSLMLPGLSIILEDPFRMCASTTMRTITFN